MNINVVPTYLNNVKTIEKINKPKTNLSVKNSGHLNQLILIPPVVINNILSAKTTRKTHGGGGGAAAGGGITFDLTTYPLKTLFYYTKSIDCHICKNTLFFKINSSLARSVVANFFSVFSGTYKFVKHPMKMFVCAKCLACRFVYPLTLWNRIHTTIIEKRANKMELRDLNYQKYRKYRTRVEEQDSAIDNMDDDYDEDADPEYKNTIVKNNKNYLTLSKVVQTQNTNGGGGGEAATPPTENIEDVNTTATPTPTHNAMTSTTTGGVGIKSHTIVNLKFNHETILCPICNFGLYYKVFMTLKPAKKDVIAYDTIYGMNSAANMVQSTPNVSAAIAYNKIEEGIIESLSQALTTFVCAECYHTIMVYPSTFYGQYKAVIKSYRKYKENILNKKNEMAKLNELKRYQENAEPIQQKFKYANIEEELLKQIRKKQNSKTRKLFFRKDKNKELSKTKNKEFLEGGAATVQAPVLNESGQQTIQRNPELEVDVLDLPLKKIKYKSHNFICELCKNDKFYMVNMSIERSKTWQILLPRFVIFNHPIIICICNNCFKSMVRYNFFLLDYDPR